MPVMVRNTETGPTVFSVPEDKIMLEWQGAGDPAGGDVQYVPDSLLEHIQFAKMIRRGLFLIETDDEAQASIDLQGAAYQTSKDSSAATVMASLDPEVNNDLVQASCVGPANRGTGICNEPVAVKEKVMAERPVLCPRHSTLAPQFALTEADGKPVWVRTTLAPRETQQNTPQ